MEDSTAVPAAVVSALETQAEDALPQQDQPSPRVDIPATAEADVEQRDSVEGNVVVIESTTAVAEDEDVEALLVPELAPVAHQMEEQHLALEEDAEQPQSLSLKSNVLVHDINGAAAEEARSDVHERDSASEYSDEDDDPRVMMDSLPLVLQLLEEEEGPEAVEYAKQYVLSADEVAALQQMQMVAAQHHGGGGGILMPPMGVGCGGKLVPRMETIPEENGSSVRDDDRSLDDRSLDADGDTGEKGLVDDEEQGGAAAENEEAGPMIAADEREVSAQPTHDAVPPVVATGAHEMVETPKGALEEFGHDAVAGEAPADGVEGEERGRSDGEHEAAAVAEDAQIDTEVAQAAPAQGPTVMLCDTNMDQAEDRSGNNYEELGVEREQQEASLVSIEKPISREGRHVKVDSDDDAEADLEQQVVDDLRAMAQRHKDLPADEPVDREPVEDGEITAGIRSMASKYKGSSDARMSPDDDGIGQRGQQPESAENQGNGIGVRRPDAEPDKSAYDRLMELNVFLTGEGEEDEASGSGGEVEQFGHVEIPAAGVAGEAADAKVEGETVEDDDAVLTADAMAANATTGEDGSTSPAQRAAVSVEVQEAEPGGAEEAAPPTEVLETPEVDVEVDESPPPRHTGEDDLIALGVLDGAAAGGGVLDGAATGGGVSAFAPTTEEAEAEERPAAEQEEDPMSPTSETGATMGTTEALVAPETPVAAQAIAEEEPHPDLPPVKITADAAKQVLEAIVAVESNTPATPPEPDEAFPEIRMMDEQPGHEERQMAVLDPRDEGVPDSGFAYEHYDEAEREYLSGTSFSTNPPDGVRLTEDFLARVTEAAMEEVRASKERRVLTGGNPFDGDVPSPRSSSVVVAFSEHKNLPRRERIEDPILVTDANGVPQPYGMGDMQAGGAVDPANVARAESEKEAEVQRLRAQEQEQEEELEAKRKVEEAEAAAALAKSSSAPAAAKPKGGKAKGVPKVKITAKSKAVGRLLGPAAGVLGAMGVKAAGGDHGGAAGPNVAAGKAAPATNSANADGTAAAGGAPGTTGANSNLAGSSAGGKAGSVAAAGGSTTNSGSKPGTSKGAGSSSSKSASSKRRGRGKDGRGGGRAEGDDGDEQGTPEDGEERSDDSGSSSDGSSDSSSDGDHSRRRRKKKKRSRRRRRSRSPEVSQLHLDEEQITKLVMQVARRCVLDEVIVESKNEKQLLNILRLRDEEIRKALASRSEMEGQVNSMQQTVDTYRGQLEFLQKERDELMEKLAAERVLSQHAQVFVDNQSTKAQGLEDILKEERKMFTKDLRRLQQEVETSKEAHRVEVLAYRRALSVEEAKVASLMSEVKQLQAGELAIPASFESEPSSWLDNVGKKKKAAGTSTARDMKTGRGGKSPGGAADAKLLKKKAKARQDAVSSAYGQKFPATRITLPKLI